MGTSIAPVWVELLRAGLLGLAGVLLGLTLYVVVVYGQRAYGSRATDRRRTLPRHVTGIAFSYSLLVIVTAGTQLELLVNHTSPSWRLPLLVVAYSVGAWALRLILIHTQPHRSRL